MKCLTHLVLVVAAATVAVGCGGQDRPGNTDQPASQSEAANTSEPVDEKQSLLALKELGANVALDEEGRAKVVRLTGPEVTDAELKHVGALTNLRGLYLDGTKVTDAGMTHLESLTKLETLYCVGVTGAPQQRAIHALEEQTETMFIETPLTDVLDTLKDYHNVPIKIDEEALDAAGIPSDTPITAEHRQVPLRDALNAMLEPLELVSTVDSGTLIVTTKGAFAEKHPNLTALREAAPNLKDVLVDW